MGWLLPAPDLNAGETVLWSRPANRAQSARLQVGGTLCLTEQRLIFVPGRFEGMLGGERWSTERARVQDVLAIEANAIPQLGPRAAGNRRRICVVTADGPRQVFLVNGARQAVAYLRQALAVPR
jgi:hypothetical protein